MDALSELVSESIYVLRETKALFQRPVVLFSGGKDSLTILHLCRLAFPGKPFPFPVLHIDTGHNFPETLEFRDRIISKLGAELIVGSVEETIRAGRAADETGPYPSRNRQQARTLMDAMKDGGFDAAIGGARRDEEKARAKERFFSLRDEKGAWTPENQRPELWNLYNNKLKPGQQMRVFPLNNWTERDVWRFLLRENAEVPSLYFTHSRECVQRADGSWLPVSPFISPPNEDKREMRRVRFRTVGDMTCTAPVFSEAQTIEEILSDISHSRISERGSRMDDKRSESAMEDRKREGYF